MLKNFTMFTLILFFSSCGGDGSQHEPLQERTLYLKAPAIDGMDYTCGERKGISKAYSQNGIIEHGVVNCIYSPVHLSLGSLYIGTIDDFNDKQSIYPQDLVPSFDGDFNNEKLLKIAIFLNSIKGKKEYITISKEIKDAILIKSLDELTIEELREEILKLGITPITVQKAKIELLLNAGGKNIGRPTIEPFEEEISTALTVGSTIGKLSMNRGDSELITPLALDGEGKENFIINKNGTIKLAKNIDTSARYKLIATAINQFGYTKESVTIYVKDGTKIGKAQMGRLSGATVTISKLNPDGSKQLLYTDTTKTNGSLNIIGNFELQDDMLEDSAFYLYEVDGGEDIDIDNNGKKDKLAVKNRGKLRLLTKGIWVKNATHKIRVTPLSDMLYSYVEGCRYEELEKKLNSYSKILLKKSLDLKEGVDAQDIMIFDPLNDMDKLYNTLTYKKIYNRMVDKIRDGDIDNYKKSLFSAFTIDSYSANAVEIVGSYVYTIDMMGSGEFRIYDLETRELVGKLKLPNTPISEDTHVLYVNLLKHIVTIGSLTDWSYIINIKNHKKPFLIGEPFMVYSILSGNFSRMAIGKSHILNLFTKNREFYSYGNSSEKKEQKVKFFKTDKNEVKYLSEFNSQLFIIDSLWVHNNDIYIVGDKKIHIFRNKNGKIEFKSVCSKMKIRGNIIGIEESILYIMSGKELTLIDVKSIDNPKFIERLTVPFSYKLGVKTNGRYISTESQTIDIEALRATRKSK